MDEKDRRSASFFARARPSSSQLRPDPTDLPDESAAADPGPSRSSETIEGVSEPSSPETVIEDPLEGPSMLTSLLRRSPPDQSYLSVPTKADQIREEHVLDDSEDDREISSRPATPGKPHLQKDAAGALTETAPLLLVSSHQSWQSYGARNGRRQSHTDLEGQKTVNPRRSWWSRTIQSAHLSKERTVDFLRVARDPKCWDRRALWQNLIVTPVASLPAVIVGLLLNILDALSYGQFYS